MQGKGEHITTKIKMNMNGGIIRRNMKKEEK
jgi:hypothetical protein